MELMKPYRSMLFVPGNKPSWMAKAADYGADALILDLEDSVPDREKVSARPLVKEGMKVLRKKGQACYVRLNGFATGLTFDDLGGVLGPELKGVILPKAETVADMKELDTLLRHFEKRMGIPVGSIETPLVLETAKAMRSVYELAISCPRVRRITLAAGPGGDAARAIGYIWSKGGRETLFLRSKTILDCRAGGIPYPMISSWWNLKDLAGLEQDALGNRQLGFRGQTVIHPSHVPVVNKVFTPSAEEVAYYEGLVQAMEEAERRGVAAVAYKGDMVDEAMLRTAKEMLEFAGSLGLGA